MGYFNTMCIDINAMDNMGMQLHQPRTLRKKALFSTDVRGYSHLNVEAYLNRNDKRNVYDTNIEWQEILICPTYSG